jgi:hypothetical protein
VCSSSHGPPRPRPLMRVRPPESAYMRLRSRHISYRIGRTGDYLVIPTPPLQATRLPLPGGATASVLVNQRITELAHMNGQRSGPFASALRRLHALWSAQGRCACGRLRCGVELVRNVVDACVLICTRSARSSSARLLPRDSGSSSSTVRCVHRWARPW